MPGRAERDAHADLGRALGHEERDQSEYSHRRKSDSEEGEGRGRKDCDADRRHAQIIQRARAAHVHDHECRIDRQRDRVQTLRQVEHTGADPQCIESSFTSGRTVACCARGR
jgi:hypothetical protein